MSAIYFEYSRFLFKKTWIFKISWRIAENLLMDFAPGRKSENGTANPETPPTGYVVFATVNKGGVFFLKGLNFSPASFNAKVTDIFRRWSFPGNMPTEFFITLKKRLFGIRFLSWHLTKMTSFLRRSYFDRLCVIVLEAWERRRRR